MLDLKALKFNQLLFIFEYSHWSVEIITQHSSHLTIWLCKNQSNTFETAHNNILTQETKYTKNHVLPVHIHLHFASSTYTTKMSLCLSAAAVTHQKRD
jgi:hypothetical protein